MVRVLDPRVETCLIIHMRSDPHPFHFGASNAHDTLLRFCVLKILSLQPKPCCHSIGRHFIVMNRRSHNRRVVLFAVDGVNLVDQPLNRLCKPLRIVLEDQKRTRSHRTWERSRTKTAFVVPAWSEINNVDSDAYRSTDPNLRSSRTRTQQSSRA